MPETPLPGDCALPAPVPAPVVVIGGPTASGKSALALDIARRFGGAVVNADSMQVYRELRVLTARPDEEDLARAPHLLYGILPAAEACSAARWRSLAMEALADLGRRGLLPVVVGGTGLYLRALMEGIADLPPIPEEVRRRARELRDRLGVDAFHAELAARDPEMAERLNPADSARTLRAWEVMEATGRSLAAWQADPVSPPPGLRFLPVFVDPPRDLLYARCDARFAAMMERGALEEVAALDALGLDPAMPAMKALGVPELREHLHGRLSLDEAIARAQMQTRRYAKRQVTWFRHQWSDSHGWHVPDAQQTEKLMENLSRILRDFR